MAKKWVKFPHADKAYAYDAAGLKKNWARLHKVVAVLVGTATIVSAIALVQFLFQIDITAYLAIPGLQEKHEAIGFEERGAAVRVASTRSGVSGGS